MYMRVSGGSNALIVESNLLEIEISKSTYKAFMRVGSISVNFVNTMQHEKAIYLCILKRFIKIWT